MAKFSKQCGPNATDNYDAYTEYYSNSGKCYERSHQITGEGIVTGCQTQNSSNYFDYISVGEGITELEDDCFSRRAIPRITLPSSLKKIGNRCFKSSRITSISLPENLEEIGEDNFPATLTELTIPPHLSKFPVSNIYNCDNLTKISVDEKSKTFKSIDGVLYNYDVTEIISCPIGKEGKFFIPSSVKRIGDYCFYKCQKLTAIICPASVEEIGDSAFMLVKTEKIVIRNGVKKIGKYCFTGAAVMNDFIFSQMVTSIPEGAFRNFYCVSKLNSIGVLEHIGQYALSTGRAEMLPEKISLFSAKTIDDFAFSDVKRVSTYELFSNLEKIGKHVFANTSDNAVIRVFSAAPFRIDYDAFAGIGENAMLVVPKGTKQIYESATPWNSFPNIAEWDMDTDGIDESTNNKVSDDVFGHRLKSILNSKINADRFYLQELLSDLLINYLHISSDKEYDEALNLIRYNRGFLPSIIPDFENRMCREWPYKYKLAFLNEAVKNGVSVPLYSHGEDTIELPHIQEPLTLPTIETLQLSTKLQPENEGTVDVFFDGDILKQIQNHLSFARKTVKIAVSWFTNYSLFKQIRDMAESGIAIQLITNNDLINNGGYCLNLNELISKNVEISLIEYPHLLHHKFCIIDNSIVINGSYNWTRFSSKNYENVIIVKDNPGLIKQFNEEFDNILNQAEYKCIEKMPETVKERSEYDRSAFRQYITEELDAEARESSNERDKITALQKAIKLNPSYLEKINPSAKNEYGSALKTIEEAENIQRNVVAMIEGEGVPQKKTKNFETQEEKESTQKSITKKTSEKKTAIPRTQGNTPIPTVLSQRERELLDNVKASDLLMVLDVSGSMEKTYSHGHVHSITKKALSASLAITDTEEVSVWTFGTDASFLGTIGIDKIGEIENIKCKKEGTNLFKFISKADNSIKENALVIIFTDDDSGSINNAVSGMEKRQNVFWQIIVYGNGYPNISNAISKIDNVSVVGLSDYASKSDAEISQILLRDYIAWKKGQ